MKKRLVALILCFFLTFHIGVVGYGQAVEGGEFIGEITTTFSSAGTALLTLMALLGVTPEVATVAAIGGVTAMGAYTVSKFEEYARQELGYTDDTIPNFLEDIKDGVVSTASDGFSAFKSWVSSLFNNSSSVPVTSTFMVNSTNMVYGYYINRPAYISMVDYPFAIIQLSDSCCYFIAPYSCSYHQVFDGTRVQDGSLGMIYKDINYNDVYVAYGLDLVADSSVLKFRNNNIKDVLSTIDINDFFPTSVISDFLINPGLSDYIGAGGSMGDLTLEDINDLPLSGTDSISINLENINEKLGSIESVLERVIAGEIPLTKVRDTAGVVPTTKDDVLTEEGTVPKDKYKGNEEDLPPKVVAPSYDTDSFKVDGLQNVFPFCIPFDLINFIGVLKADPETPVFVINCSFLGKKFEDLTFTIDLKPFDPLAKICRYSELFLFCVGLIILTRNIIKG